MKRRNKIVIAILLILSIGGEHLYAQKMSNKDSLVADFAHLIKILEETHPDPYTGFGGKVFFHKQAFDLTNNLQQQPYTVNEFADKVNAFLANIQDGHTFLQAPKRSDEKTTGAFPVAGRVIPGGLIVGVTSEEYASYLGSRIVSINGLPLENVLEKVATRSACENLYGRYAKLAPLIGNSKFIASLSPNSEKDTLVLSIETPAGIQKDLSISILSIEEIQSQSFKKVAFDYWEEMPSEPYMRYKWMDKQQQIMLLRLKYVIARENFEYQRNNNWSSWYEMMRWFYQKNIKKEMPADTLQALADIPSFSETFGNMLKEMKAKKSPTLIIDLRGNDGGWTGITLPSLYQLYGDRYLEKDMDTHFHRLLSPLYLNKINMSLDKMNEKNDSNYHLGDYLFEKDEQKDTTSIQIRRKQFIDNCMSYTKKELTEQEGKAFYSPQKIYVIINERTFSAAFHYAFYLWKMGATVVGIPCMQAPNTFMEQTPFCLPHTRMEGSISNSMQVFLPSNDPRSKIFWPDIMLTYADYKKYKFNMDAEVMYLIDLINK